MNFKFSISNKTVYFGENIQLVHQKVSYEVIKESIMDIVHINFAHLLLTLNVITTSRKHVAKRNNVIKHNFQQMLLLEIEYT